MTDQRPVVAEAIRALAHTMAGKQLDSGEQTDRILSLVTQAAAELARAPEAVRDPGAELDRMLSYRDGDMNMFAAPTCPATGPASPMGLGARVHRTGDVIGASVRLGPASAGLSGVAHGGHVCTVIDGVMGLAAVNLIGGVAVTANLTVSFSAPIPTGAELTLSVRVADSAGRKHRLECTGYLAGSDRPVVRADALFIQPRSDS